MKPPIPVMPLATHRDFLSPPGLTMTAERRLSALLVVLFHGALLIALLTTRPAQSQPPQPILQVSFLAAPPITSPAPATTPIQPLPQPRQALPRSRPVNPAAPLRPTAASSGPPTALAAPANPTTSNAVPTGSSATSASDAPPPTKVGNGPLTAPRFDADYLENPKPTYPALSRRMGEEGKVVLRVFVDATGRVGKLEILHSSSFPRLDQAALQAVGQWRFVPARQGGEPLAAWVQVPLVFRLDQ